MKDINKNSPGYRKTKVGWIPKEWECVPLGKISKITMGQSPSSKAYNNEKIGLPLIQGNADCKNRLTIPRNWTKEITKTCEAGDIILSVRAPVGSVSRSTLKGCIGRGVCSINSQGINEYLFYYLLVFEKKWKNISQGSTFQAISSKEVKKLPIPLPPYLEQKKIAEILSTWDEAIERTRKLIDAKKRRKKALMQQLLMGKKRLPEFGDPWKETFLSELINLRVSGIDKKSKPFEIPVKLCNYTDVYYNESVDSSMAFMSATATPRELEQFELKKGDILLTKDSETADDIASGCYIREDLPGVLCGYHLALLRPDKKLIRGDFLSHYLNQNHIRYAFSCFANGVTRFGLTKSAFHHIRVCVPSIDEQRSIAEVLSISDDEIIQIEDKLKALKKQKLGLMQKLLTGEVRVKF